MRLFYSEDEGSGFLRNVITSQKTTPSTETTVRTSSRESPFVELGGFWKTKRPTVPIRLRVHSREFHRRQRRRHVSKAIAMEIYVMTPLVMYCPCFYTWLPSRERAVDVAIRTVTTRPVTMRYPTSNNSALQPLPRCHVFLQMECSGRSKL